MDGTPPTQPQGQMPPINPAAPSIPKKKMSKAKLGCLVFLAAIAAFVLLAVTGAFMAGSSQDKTSQDTNNVVQDLKNSPLAQKILGLNGNDAFMSGLTDGWKSASNFENPTNDLLKNGTVQDFIEMESNLFILVGAAQPNIDTTVLSEYSVGWNDGANSTTGDPLGTSQLTKADFYQKIQFFFGKAAPSGVVYGWNEKRFIRSFGKPDTTQTGDNQTFWYYTCSDGSIQLSLDTGALTYQGAMMGKINTN